MTLAESFMERNDINKKIARTQEELSSVLITEEGAVTIYTAADKEREILILLDKKMELNIKIDKANEVNKENLQKLKNLDKKISFYSNLRSTIMHADNRKKLYKGFSSEETDIKMIKNLSEIYLSETLEALENERRALDKKIQKLNWQTEI